MFRWVLFIARKDILYLLRQRETILWTFLMPGIFFYFIGTITGGFGPGGAGMDALALSAPEDAGFLVDQVAARLEAQDYEIQRPAPGADLDGFRRRLIVPPAFTDSVLAGRVATVELVREGEGRSADYDRVRVSRALYTVLADLVVVHAESLALTSDSFERLKQAPRSLRLDVKPAGKRRHVPVGYEQTIPGTLVMFTLLVLLTSGAVLLVVERREGLLRRLASTPIPRGAIVLGKWAGRMALGLVQIGFGVVLGTFLFKMKWGPDLPMVLILLFAWAGLNASLGLLMGCVARSEGQAVGIGVFSANLMAALGGCWWPIEITPRWMQALSLALPTGWTMDAMHKLVSFQAGAAGALPHVVVISAAAFLAGWGAVRLFRFQ